MNKLKHCDQWILIFIFKWQALYLVFSIYFPNIDTHSFKVLHMIGDRAAVYFCSKVIRVCKVFNISVCVYRYIYM